MGKSNNDLLREALKPTIYWSKIASKSFFIGVCLFLLWNI